jgi:hypothetical protein
VLLSAGLARSDERRDVRSSAMIAAREPAPIMMPNVLAVIGILGSALLFIADVTLVYTPLRAKDFNVFNAALDKSPRRLVVGSLLGVFAIPLVIAGFGSIYVKLEPAGPWLALPPVIVGATAYVIGAAFHAAIPFFVAAIQANPSPEARTSPPLSTMWPVFRVLQTALFVAVATSSVWLLVSVLSGASHYPRWAAALSPAATGLVLRIATRFSPPRVVGVLFPAANNLTMMIFLAVSLAVP